MSEEFTKHFTVDGTTSLLPDAGYWLSREELILTYLHQRGAKVPKVNIKNLKQKSLLMQDVGNSLFIELTKKNSGKDFHKINGLIVKSIKSLVEIFNLGVLHLDIALRNIATPGKGNDSIFVLDFVHCLSTSNKLQKPLPLLPIKELHHPDLYLALKQDWEGYFAYLGISPPALDNSLELSNKEFSEYWSESISVQRLSNNLAILCHGIGNLLEEVANNIFENTRDKDIYLSEAKKLKKLNAEQAQFAIDSVIQELEGLSSSNTPMRRIDDATPIPTVRDFSFTEPQDTRRSRNKRPAIPRLLDYTSITRFFKRARNKYLRLGCWALLILNAAWINLVISAASVKLSDWTLLLVMINFITVPIGIVIDLFATKSLWSKTSKILINILIVTEVILITAYPEKVLTQLWIWLPSVLIITVASIYSNKSR